MNTIAPDMFTANDGIGLVMPLLQQFGTVVIDTNECDQAERLQREFGDYFIKSKHDGIIYPFEVKTEKRYTSNLFIETWSNRTFSRPRPGWSITCGASKLLTVFLDVQAAFFVDNALLFAWCHVERNLIRYREKVVNKSANGHQRNITTGCPVPLSELIPKTNGSCWQYVADMWRKVELSDIENTAKNLAELHRRGA